MEDLEEYHEIMDSLDSHLKDRAKVLMTNYGVPPERFADIYRQYEFNLSNEKDNSDIPFERLIIQEVERKLQGERMPQKAK